MSDRSFKQLFVSNFNPETVEALVRASSKEAPLFIDVCRRCKKEYTVYAYTAVAQFRKAEKQSRPLKFRPPVVCSNCFSVTKGKSVPTPPRNAALRKSVEVERVPEVIDTKELPSFRSRWENREVVIRFKKQVTFSDKDESGTPDEGRVVAVTRATITINRDGEPVHNARTFSLCDVAEIRSLKHYVKNVAEEAAAEAIKSVGLKLAQS